VKRLVDMADTPKTPPAATSTDVEAELAKLREEIKVMRGAMPLSLTPEHGAGEGMEVAETWSQYDQEQARAAAAP
jgi:hypothetical protein